MKAIIYARVSTEDQDEENQIIKLRDYADRQGWSYDVRREKESTRNTRPVKESVLADARRGDYDIVLVWKLDRWARSVRELVTDVTELYSKNVKFISLQDNIDLTTPNGKLQFHIIAAFAEFERSLIRQRTLAGLERAKAQGKTLGRPQGSKDKKRRKKGGYYLRYKQTPPVN